MMIMMIHYGIIKNAKVCFIWPCGINELAHFVNFSTKICQFFLSKSKASISIWIFNELPLISLAALYWTQSGGLWNGLQWRTARKEEETDDEVPVWKDNICASRKKQKKRNKTWVLDKWDLVGRAKELISVTVTQPKDYPYSQCTD